MKSVRKNWNMGEHAGRQYVRQHRIFIIETALIGTGVFEFIRYWRLDARPAAAAIAVAFFLVGPVLVFWWEKRRNMQVQSKKGDEKQ